MGQRVVVRGMVEHADVARAIVTAAYSAGASHVTVEYVDQHVQRAAVDNAPLDTLGKTLPHELEGIRAWREDRPAVISLTGNPNPRIMDGADPARVVASMPVDRIRETLPIIATNEVAWTMVAAPNPGWAQSIYGAADVERLWKAVAVATRLDADDPVQAWRDHLEKLAHRRDLLNDRGFDRMRFRGPGTDLVVGLNPRSRWTAAGMTNADGVEFVANMPTEEVYTAPDWRRADGTLTTTAPFFLMGANVLVEGLMLELSDGSIRSASAQQGEEAVHRQLESVPRARHLGEVAVVDKDSRVRAAGHAFNDMLYDENVGCHVAWGNGYPTTFDGALGLSADDRVKEGLNQAATHVDVVVGSPDVELDGLDSSGHVTPVLRGDEFVLS
jgi:aminopeptidase